MNHASRVLARRLSDLGGGTGAFFIAGLGLDRSVWFAIYWVPKKRATPGACTVMKESLVRPLPEGPLDIVGDVHGEIDAINSLMRNLGYASDGTHLTAAGWCSWVTSPTGALTAGGSRKGSWACGAGPRPVCAWQP